MFGAVVPTGLLAVIRGTLGPDQRRRQRQRTISRCQRGKVSSLAITRASKQTAASHASASQRERQLLRPRQGGPLPSRGQDDRCVGGSQLAGHEPDHRILVKAL